MSFTSPHKIENVASRIFCGIWW